MTPAGIWKLGDEVMATGMFVWANIQQYFPDDLGGYIERYVHEVIDFLYPYLITFPEFTDDYEHLRRREALSAIQNYLREQKRLRSVAVKDSKPLVLSMGDNEQVIDECKGVKIWWASCKVVPKTKSFSSYSSSHERRFYELTSPRRHCDIIQNFVVLRRNQTSGKVRKLSRRRHN